MSLLYIRYFLLFVSLASCIASDDLTNLSVSNLEQLVFWKKESPFLYTLMRCQDYTAQEVQTAFYKGANDFSVTPERYKAAAHYYHTFKGFSSSSSLLKSKACEWGASTLSKEAKARRKMGEGCKEFYRLHHKLLKKFEQAEREEEQKKREALVSQLSKIPL